MIVLKSAVTTVAILGFLAFSACVGDKSGIPASQSAAPVATPNTPKSYSFESPKANQTFSLGEKLEIKVNHSGNEALADSIVFYIDGVKNSVIVGNGTVASAFSETLSPGIRRLKMTAFFGGGKTESLSIPLLFLSDIVPSPYSYQVIGSFPHDKGAYTQGFEYNNGYFLEGTGQYGESSLRKTLPGTGDIIKFRNLSSDLFGEGITLLNGKIYQLTYRSQVGFIYDAETFEQLQKFFYQNREGWGLCNNGSELIMSDGTHMLYFIDPQYFSVNRKIEVFDNVSEVDSLNELEFINGIIYANRYMTNEIVMIDPLTGKVTGRADMRGLLKAGDRHPQIDVLNGIAWDNEQKRLFVTGKYWPRIFRVELIEK